MTDTEQQLLSKLTILYVEDEDVIRENITEILSIIFSEVISFNNAEDGLQYFESNLPDIVLSDINLPNMSGIDFFKEIRDKNQSIPLILLTAYTNTEVLLEATKLKLINYIVKPVRFDELVDSFKLAVRDILESKSHILKFSDSIIYDLSTNILSKNNKEINLTSSENRLLLIFIKYKHTTISTQTIKNLLWNDPYNATDSALKSVLNKLRTKIGKESIKNVSGIGYHLV